MLLEASRHSPFLGTFRHSPSLFSGAVNAQPTKSKVGLGFDKLLQNDGKRPVVSQVQLSLDKHRSRLLWGIPITRYMACPAVFRDELPHCAVCLEAFSDGDELRTLSCSHCYHRKCIDHWLLGCASDEAATCPQCRQPVSPPAPPQTPAPAPTAANAAVTGDGMEDGTLPSVTSDLSLAHTHTLASCGSDDLIPSDSYLRIGAYLSSLEIGTSDTLYDQVHQHREGHTPTSAGCPCESTEEDSDGDLTEISLRTVVRRMAQEQEQEQQEAEKEPPTSNAPRLTVATTNRRTAAAIFSTPPVFESSYVFVASDG
jgi:hypothetical protein